VRERPAALLVPFAGARAGASRLGVSAAPGSHSVARLLFRAQTRSVAKVLATMKRHTMQQKVLVVCALALVLVGGVFIVPVVNHGVMGLFWFLLKVFTIIYLLIWFRGTFPRFRYDQLMNIGWKIAIPVGMAAVLINAVLGMLRHG
jgi:hypothetical protein